MKCILDLKKILSIYINVFIYSSVIVFFISYTGFIKI